MIHTYFKLYKRKTNVLAFVLGACLGLAIAWGLLAFLGSPWIALFDLVCLALSCS